jgi:hypothetical protein
MENPWTLAGPRVRIARPEHPWETIGDPDVNEGPEALQRGGLIHIVYSASGSWTDDYCLGILTAPATANLLDPASWTKHAEPVFRSGNGVLAPGHASFVRSPDDREDWIVYHAAQRPGSGWARQVRAQAFTWDAADRPVFGVPADPNTRQALPSGEPEHLRLDIERVDTPGRGLELSFTWNRSGAGPEVFAVRYQAPGEGGARLQVRTGESESLVVRCPATAAGQFSTAVLRLELPAGPSRVRLRLDDPGGRLDGVDVIPDGR